VNGYSLLIQAAVKHRREFSHEQMTGIDILPHVDVILHPDDPDESTLRAMGREGVLKARQSGLFSLLDQAAAAPRLARAMDGTPERLAQLIDIGADADPASQFSVLEYGSLPEFREFRALVRLTFARMTMATGTAPSLGVVIERDPEEFLAGVRVALALCRAMVHQEALESRSQGQSIVRGVVQRIMADLPLIGMSDSELVQVAKLAAEHAQKVPLFTTSLRSERALERILAERLFTNDGDPDVGAWFKYKAIPDLRDEDLDQSRRRLRWILLRMSKDDYLRHADSMNEMVSDWWKPTPAERGPRDRWEAFAATRDVVIRAATLRLSVLRQVVEVDDEAAMFITALGAAVAVERYRLATGAYPADLAAVVARGLLPSVPTDLVARAPLGYRLLEKPDAQGRLYLLYSIGADGVDDRAERVSESLGAKRQRALHGPAASPTMDVILNEP
jgi:hypothetical protein